MSYEPNTLTTAPLRYLIIIAVAYPTPIDAERNYKNGKRKGSEFSKGECQRVTNARVTIR